MSIDADRSENAGEQGRGGSGHGGDEPRGGESRRMATVDLEVRPEQRSIRTGGCFRYVDFHLLVSRPQQAESESPAKRPALALALVLDRSGSMQGEKLRTAKRAALSVVDRLDARDTVAVVVFDNQIETLQVAAPATEALKAALNTRLAAVEARAMTALHEGWLSGCQALTSDETQSGERLARCFLLTDGLANVGLTDPEQIAGQAAGIREKAGIGTSTFGIGEDYSEELLGPMASAGGGTFHHLRSAGEISTTFVAELGELLAVAAAHARLEIEAEPGMAVEVVSGYWAAPENQQAGGPSRWSVALGDLVAGDEHHIIARVRFPEQKGREEQGLRARLVWMHDGAQVSTTWRELRFAYAADAVCDAEPRDSSVALYAGQHLSDRSMREAIRMSKSGDLIGAQHMMEQSAGYVEHLSTYAPELGEEVRRMRTTSTQLAHGPMPSAASKATYFDAQRRSQGKRDLRGGDAVGGDSSGGKAPQPESSAGSAGAPDAAGSTGNGGTDK
ncbi:MAG TPA: VWA domain-containing protein [Ktedonobacterales bacterium]